MNKLVVFSSETGNTEKLASTVAEALLTNYDISHVNLAPNPENYDTIFIGYKLNKGTIDDSLIEYIHDMKNKNIFLFGTMGISPCSPYGKLVKRNIQSIFEKCNHVIGHFLCQGKISDDIMERWIALAKSDPSNIHAIKQVESYDSALSHPDNNDMLNLRTTLIESLNSL